MRHIVAGLMVVVVWLPGWAVAQEMAIPPSQDTAEKALADSPRHQEYVKIVAPGMDVPLNVFAVYPEREDKAPVILVIHEIFGMTDWVNSVADHLASQGFIALAPDLITGMEGNPMGLIRGLSKEQIVERLDAVRDYALTIPAANGKVASIGFCWGGSSSFLYATAQEHLDAAIVCYGSAPSKEELAKIEAPVLGNYGEMDARVNVTIDPAKEEMDRLGKVFEYGIFDNAGHGFLRAQEGREGSNLAATQQAWPRIIEFLRKYTEVGE